MKPQGHDDSLAMVEDWLPGRPMATFDPLSNSFFILIALNTAKLHTICHFLPRRQLLTRFSSDLEPWPVRRTRI